MSDEESKIEKFADRLRTQIVKGEFGAKGRIPPVSQLMKDWDNVAKATVYAVLQILQSEGIIRRVGNSFVVNYPTLGLEGITENFERFLRAQGHDVTMENIIDPVVEPMPSEVAQLFGEVEGVHVVHRMRKQGIPGLPLRLAENWYPVTLAGEFVEAMRTNDRMDVLGAIREKHGVFIENCQDVLMARIPNSEEARLLELVRTEPVVEIRRSNFASNGSPVMYNKIIHAAPHFKFTYRYSPGHWKQ
jgi:DNA-binding GntR family transcriptional regulator